MTKRHSADSSDFLGVIFPAGLIYVDPPLFALSRRDTSVMTMTRIHHHLLVAFSVLTLTTCRVSAFDDAPTKLVIQRCIDCHAGEDAEGGMDLKALVERTASLGEKPSVKDHAKFEELAAKWSKVEAAILEERMPPAGEDKLSAGARDAVAEWFRQRFVLKNGKPHIGPTPLRRLTHYEFIGSVEDLLGVTLGADYNFLTSVDVEKSFVEKTLPLEVPGKSGFVNDAHAQARQSFPMQQYIKCIDFALSKIKEDKTSLKHLFGVESVPAELSNEQLRSIADSFLRRALRGRATREHSDKAIAVYHKAIVANDTMIALKAMMRSSLLLPEFYYRLESSKEKNTPYAISDIELATRLSYFLTSSTPDDELIAVAETGKLRDPATLESQVTRLLSQPRRIALAERFAAQWIGFDELISSSQSGSVPTTNRAQYDELFYFFDELFRSNRSVLDIVDSEWFYVSRYNIQHYGKEQFKTRQLFDEGHADVLSHRRLTGAKRRGIESIYDPPTLHTVVGDRYGGAITSAAVMRITSAPTRTSPVRRGVWLLDKILGDRLEAPENVPPIDDAASSLQKAKPSKLDILRAHTGMDSCMVCHKEIDPIGIGLENFDQAGRWRTQYRDKQQVVSKGVLPGGKPFSSPRELKSQLLEVYREQIVRNFIQRLLSYAIGRSLQPYDRITVDKIYEGVVAGDYRSGVVLRQVINSPQFQSRQDKEQ